MPKEKVMNTVELPQAPPIHVVFNTSFVSDWRSVSKLGGQSKMLRGSLLYPHWAWDWKPLVHNIPLNSSRVMFGSYEVNERQLFFLSACSCPNDIYFFWHEYASETFYYGVVWNCLKAKNQHDFPAYPHTTMCQECKAIYGIQKIGMNPTWCSRSFLSNYMNWHHTPKTWAQNPYYSIFLGYRTSEFWGISIFKILS